MAFFEHVKDPFLDSSVVCRLMILKFRCIPAVHKGECTDQCTRSYTGGQWATGLVDNAGQTALHLAATSGDLAILTSFLLINDVNRNLADGFGNVAVQVAWKRGHLNVGDTIAN